MGGMGEVFLARQIGVLDRLAILKSLRTDLTQEADFVDQFLDEARVAATLNHPNIVSIYDVGDDAGTYYIAMEYVPGEDLSKLWYAAAKAGVGLPFQVSVRVCFEAALALDHAHKAKDVRGSPLNIVHRDVSPQNIMVRGDGVVKLVDFGIAKAANKASRTQAGMVKGKLQYMSPEQVRGEALDGRSDQFSLGAVLWEMCTGRRLFKSENEVGTINKILQAPVPRPSVHVPGFPPELESAIMKMLQRDADQRYRSLGEVAADLKLYLDRSAITNGEVSVAAFVQQVLGNELEERTRDLTPMDNTEAAAPLPKRPSSVSGRNPSVRPLVEPGAAPFVPPKPAAVMAPSASEYAVPVQPVLGQARTENGIVAFSYMGGLHQLILDGVVDASDSYTIDGHKWQRVSETRELQKFVEIAAAARAVSTLPTRGSDRVRASLPASADLTLPLTRAPSDVRATQPVPMNDNVTTELPVARLDGPHTTTFAHDNPATLNLNLGPDQGTDPATGAFSLGDLPVAQTGTWAAPDVNAALQAQRAQRDADELDSKHAGRKRWSTASWVLLGVLGAVMLVGAAAYVVGPKLWGDAAVDSQSPINSEVARALTALQSDDPAVLEALLAGLSAGDASSVGVHAAASLLHSRLARIELDAMRFKQAQHGAVVAPSAVVMRHRSDSYKEANAAQQNPSSSNASRFADALAALAMALYHADLGAALEFDTQAERVRRDPTTALAKQFDDELTLARQLMQANTLIQSVSQLSATASRTNPAAAALRVSVTALEGMKDQRAKNTALLGWLVLAQADGADGSGLNHAAGLLGPIAARAATDARVAPAQAWLNALSARTVDAGVVTSAAADAGVTSAATVDAGVPDTYEIALQRAQSAATAGRSSAAAKAFGAALKLKPGDVKAELGLGGALLALNQHERAQQQFQRVITKDRSNAPAFFGLGEALRAQQKTEDAKAAFSTYLELAPTGPQAEAAKNAIRQLE